MKIIGIIREDSKFLVEITQLELNKLSGKKAGCYASTDIYRVEQQFDIEQTWDYLNSILKKKEELLNIARNLRSIGDIIEAVPIPTKEILDKELGDIT